jgi:hypothetical protein
MVSGKNCAAISPSPFTDKPQTLFLTGGYGASGSLAVSEILTENGWELFSPALPAMIKQHCMMLVNATTVILIAGSQNYLVSNQTFFISNDKKV